MNIHLEPEEQDLLDSIERGEWRSVPNLQDEIKRYQRYASAYLKSIQQISVELPAQDVDSLKEIAQRSGVPVSLLLSSIVHQYITTHSQS
jgi:predicted DNA binding CopG/RHH family protein